MPVPARVACAGAPHHSSASLGRRGDARMRPERDRLGRAGRATRRRGVAGSGGEEDASGADVVLVNTCGFVEQAKKDSIDAVLAAADLKGAPGRRQAVVAVGCLAERYGIRAGVGAARGRRRARLRRLPRIGRPAGRGAAGAAAAPPTCPRDRRTLLPISPVDRQDGRPGIGRLPAASRRRPARGLLRRRLDGGPVAPLKIASGCDRRCTFCAIPRFRGAFVSRPARRDAGRGALAGRAGRPRGRSWSARTRPPTARTSATCDCSRRCCRELAAVDGIDRVRVSYLQPAEMRPWPDRGHRPTPASRDYFDLSFQHAGRPCCGGCAGSVARTRSSSCSSRSARCPRGRDPLERDRRVPR